MGGWQSVHAVCIGSLVLATHVGAQQPPPSRTAAAVATTAPQRRVVPNVTGLRLDSAQRILRQMNLAMRVEAKPDKTPAVATDTVLQQRPGAGQPIPITGIISLALKVPPKVPTEGVDVTAPGMVLQRQLVPSVIGLSLDSAQRVLTSQKLVPRVATNPSGLHALGQDVVTRQSPLARQPVPTNRSVVVEVTIVMPNVVGQNVNQARELLASRGIRNTYATEQTVGTASDVIIRQDPAPGAVVGSSLTANLTGAIEVSRQPSQRVVPNVVGTQVRDAAAILAKSGFRSGAISDDDDANVAAGIVVTQFPRAGQRVQAGAPVGLSVRTNRVRVPSVLTLTESDARQQIGAAGLRVSTVEPRDDAARPGTVIDQSPIARTPVQRGSDVSIVVARQASAAMPNLVGLSRAAATSVVRQRGLTLDLVDTSSTQIRPDTVVTQDPPQNSPVRAGDRVRFTVGTEQKLVVVPNLVGRRVDDARRAIDSARLRLGAFRGVADSGAGRVARQSPPPGRRVAPNDAIDLDTTIARAVVAVVVTPPRAELRFGDTVRFTATATMNDGTRNRARVTWSARGGGTIRDDGLFSAVGDSGSFDVVATAVAGITGTARVRVTVASTIPLPPGPVPPVPLWKRLWILWVALGISGLAIVAKVISRSKPPQPTPIAPPPITYALRAKPPSFSIDADASGRGLALSLSMTNDPGVQAIVETPFRAT